MQTAQLPNEVWIKILGNGLITIPKSFRNELGIREGEIARIKKVGKRLIIESKDVADYEVYDDKEFKQMLKEDMLPKDLAKKSARFWQKLA
jgi:bifunctional DNA-binding transcriptional regulator/antitoxin component of YhaV-PrlF toxin-antitoxin module